LNSCIMSTSFSTQTTAFDAVQTTKSLVECFDIDEKDLAEYDEAIERDQIKASKKEIAHLMDVCDAKQTESENEELSEKVVESEEETYLESECDEETEFDAELFSKEMDLALDHVRNLAAKHQEEFVDRICGIFGTINGAEPSINDISAIFGRIKQGFAEEAREDDIECNEEYDDAEDSDFDPNDDEELEQEQNDVDEDYFCSESDYETESDSDYNPNDGDNIRQFQEDQDEDIYDAESEENRNWIFGEEVENEENEDWVFGADEQSIINSENFDSEYFAAIEWVRNVARIEGQKMLENIMEELDVTKDEVLDALNNFIETEDESEEEEENENESEIESDAENEEEVDSELFSIEMDLALDNVRELAAKHKEEFVGRISGQFRALNGYEPSIDEISAIFDGIQQELAEEARDEWLEEVETESQSETESEIEDYSEQETDDEQ